MPATASVILTLLSGLAGVGLLLALLLHVLWWRKSQRQLRRTINTLSHRVAGLEQFLELQAIIPPMRIYLETSDQPWRTAEELCQAVDGWLLQHEFQPAGRFVIEELGNEQLSAYLSCDKLLVAAVRLPPDAILPYVEFCFDTGAGGQRGGVGNPPSGTVGLPIGAIGQFFEATLAGDLRLLEQMYEAARQLLQQHQPRPVEPENIAHFFEEAHELEMSWRVTSGGLTRQEIDDVLRRQGVQATPGQVALLQRQWQVAIEDYLLEFSARGRDRQATGGQMMVVHDGSLAGYLKSRLRQMLVQVSADSREVELLCTELDQILSRFSPRDAVARFRPLLPTALRFDLVDHINHPVRADVYALRG
ncbi:MAG: hypothetical protein KF752_04025 [Pirellulaceae bacterium]|nr:hypothetical protein [Pirellulaceae bacterium]